MTHRYDFCYGYAILENATYNGDPCVQLTRYDANGRILDILQCETWKDTYRWARHFARVA